MKLTSYNALYIKTETGFIGKILEWQEIIVQSENLDDCRNQLSQMLYDNILAFQQQNKPIPPSYGNAIVLDQISIKSETEDEPVNGEEPTDILNTLPETTVNTPPQPPCLKVNRFAVNLYKALHTENNLLFSPFSIATMLTVLALGARGTTQMQLIQALQAETVDEITNEMLQVMEALERLNHNKFIKIQTANALWVKASLLLAQFEAVTNQYDAVIEFIDMSDEKIAYVINAWCSEKTQGKIPQIVTPDLLTEQTRLIITNAIYFKADWYSYFENTRPATFYVSEHEEVEVLMMEKLGTRVFHLVRNGLQILCLDYRFPKKHDVPPMSMMVLLPNQVDGIIELEEKLTPELLQQWLGLLNESQAKVMDIYLPSFALNAEFNLFEALTTLGIKDAFQQDIADFSGIDGTQDLVIQTFLHKTFTAVNEMGMDASVATAVSTAPIQIDVQENEVFRADHPFIFVIVENFSGSILLMGRVLNPALSVST
ncbi:serpin family protein [Beggiatoa alba]|nr:serpin family protein [Beggiatoa alba]